MELGFGEIVVILVIVLVLFGGAKLPQLGASLGKGIRSFKDAVNGADEKPAAPAAPAALPAAPAAEAKAGEPPATGGGSAAA